MEAGKSLKYNYGGWQETEIYFNYGGWQEPEIYCNYGGWQEPENKMHGASKCPK